MEKYLFEDVKKGLESVTAEQGLVLVDSWFGQSAKFSSSFGLEDQIITHLIASANLNFEIFTLDTGRLFQETYDVFALTKQQYHLNIKTYFPDRSRVEELLVKKGPNSFYESVENRKECCFIRKVEPLQRALIDAKVWITGVRAEQSSNRTTMQLVEWDDQHQLIKYNPLLNWTADDVDSFVEKNRVPVNALHKKGYPSIGCAPCTRAIMPGEDPRAGRWWWEDSHKECGLHERKQPKKEVATSIN